MYFGILLVSLYVIFIEFRYETVGLKIITLEIRHHTSQN
jgi:hypothetical protein